MGKEKGADLPPCPRLTQWVPEVSCSLGTALFWFRKRSVIMRRLPWSPKTAGKAGPAVALAAIAAGTSFPSPAGVADSRPTRLDCTPAAFPALVIRGDDISRYPNGQPAAFRGFADPCVRRDPVNGRLWLAYSWPHMEYLGGNGWNFAVGVETHLASSTDGGKTWRRVQVLWPRTPARFTDPASHAARDGFLSHIEAGARGSRLRPGQRHGHPLHVARCFVGERLVLVPARKRVPPVMPTVLQP